MDLYKAKDLIQNQHMNMNGYLNKCVQDSMQPNRVAMQYKHRYERDSFATLNQAGLNALPSIAHTYMDNKRSNPRLRTTLDVHPKLKSAPPPVIARIVKVRIADLDIYSPETDFDCRVSINIEIDLNLRSDIDPKLIVVPPAQEKDRQADRHKDRLSYRHLAYSIDLTQVTRADTNAKTHELEVEIDANTLRDQAILLGEGKENAYEGLVKGFLDNVTMLLRFKSIN